MRLREYKSTLIDKRLIYFISVKLLSQRPWTEPEYCNFTYFLHAADKLCPTYMLRGSTVIVINDDNTPAPVDRARIL